MVSYNNIHLRNNALFFDHLIFCGHLGIQLLKTTVEIQQEVITQMFKSIDHLEEQNKEMMIAIPNTKKELQKRKNDMIHLQFYATIIVLLILPLYCFVFIIPVLKL